MYGKSVLFSRVVSNIPSKVRFKSSLKILEFLADMPKANTARITEAQRQRQHISKKSQKYGASTVYLQVLGSGARGAPNTLYLFTDQKRYLFNCGEGTQRFAHEHKVKLSRLEHVFVTGKTWRNIGGLPGLSLTLQDVGVPKIVLHGPEGLDELYNATKRFVIMKEMKVEMAKCGPSEDFEDSVMTVKYVPLGPLEDILTKDPCILKSPAKRPRSADKHEKELERLFTHDNTDYYQSEESNPKRRMSGKKQDIPKPESHADMAKKKTDKVLQVLQKKTNCTMAYICTLKKRLGTLNLEKCLEKGVKKGPLLGQLKNGHDVILEDGTLILASDVKDPDEPGPVFIVLDVPELSYLKESEFCMHFDNGLNPTDNIPSLIVHFTPQEVFQNPLYQSFLRKFGTTPRHLVLNEQNSCLGSEAAHRTQHKLHLLDPDIFPVLKDLSIPPVWSAEPPVTKSNSPMRLRGLEELKNKIALAQFQNIIYMENSCKGDSGQNNADNEASKIETISGRTLTMFHLRPKKELDRSAEPKLHIQEYIKETMDVDGFVHSLERFRNVVSTVRYERSGSEEDFPKLLFLGTGSCIPSKNRNTSAILLQISEEQSMLLDCGEGTHLQMVRFFGPKRVNSYLRTLKCIYISHLHADHHMGLIGVLQARRAAFAETETTPDPVYLLAPGQILTWLSVYDQQFERLKSEYSLIPNQCLTGEEESKYPTAHLTELTSAMLAAMGIDAVQTTLVPHCPNAFGVAVTVRGRKIVYSGDTLPSEALVQLGQDSALLIHEATMEDELETEARTKMHSTTTQAIEIGKQMNAKYTVLTHFSQRYARLPRLNANILHDNTSVGIAFDNMLITMSDLELLPHMYAPLQLMFAEHCIEMELKAAHRNRQRQRAAARSDSEDARRQRAKYRDSYASRLRLDSNRNSRSQSSSPSKIPVRPAIPRISGNKSGKSTPSVTSKSKIPDEHGFLEVYTSSVLNRPKSESSVGKSPSSNDSGYVVDSQSKTLNTVKHVCSVNIGPDLPAKGMSHPKQKVVISRKDSLSSNKDSGYGAPLVLPVHRRLQFRRDSLMSKCATNQQARLSPSAQRNLKTLITPLRIPKTIKKPAEKRPWNGSTSVNPTNGPMKWEKTIKTVNVSPNARASDRRRSPAEKDRSPMKKSSSFDKSNSDDFQSRSVRSRVKSASATLRRNRDRSASVERDSSVERNNIDLDYDYPLNKTCQESYTVCKNDEKNKNEHNRTIHRKNDNEKLKESIFTHNQTMMPVESKRETISFRNNSRPVYNHKQRKEQVLNAKLPNAMFKTSGLRQPQIHANVHKQEPKLETNNSKKAIPNKNVVRTNNQNNNRASTDPRKKTEAVDANDPRQILRRNINDSANKTAALNKDNIKPIQVIGKPGSAIRSNRSFKPQLEDIKSSLVLLRESSSTVARKKKFDEAERSKQLLSVKKKFASKQFRNDNKYDKIEGLNWISWK